MADFLYSPTGTLVAVLGYLVIGVAFLIGALNSRNWLLLTGTVAAFGVAAFLFFGRHRFIANLDRLRSEQAHPNPLDGALLVLDWVDAGRLGDLAAQMEILPSPTRRERSRARKRSGGVTGPGPLSPTASYESAASETAVYELAENPSKLIKDLVGALQRSGQIELAIADVPRVSVDEPLNEAEVESLLIKELSFRADPPDVRNIARDVASILGRGLPPERLAATKLAELESLMPGAYVLIESEWNAVENASELMLFLDALHPPREPWFTAENRVDLPDAIKVGVTVQPDVLTPRIRARMTSTFSAGVFGEVLAIDAGEVKVWPLAIFSRSPRSLGTEPSSRG